MQSSRNRRRLEVKKEWDSSLAGRELRVRTVVTIDCQYLYPLTACAYMICEKDRVAFVENNTAHAVPLLLSALAEHGYSPEQVEYAIITHVHLDHAGGSGLLMEKCPNATLLAHPRAARHVIDPARLVASAKTVYGEEVFAKVYGEIQPVEESRVRVMQDGETISFGERSLTFLHTRGHANHHFCVYDSGSDGIFTGDTFGIAYPFMQTQGPHLFPSTTPTEFDPVEARLSIDRILATQASKAFLTHFGEFTHLEEGARQLKSGLDEFEAILKEAKERTETGEALTSLVEEKVNAYFKRRAHFLPETQLNLLLELDGSLNAAGIAFAAERSRKA